MNRNSIAAMWLIGIAAALAVYLLGSDWLLDGLTDLIAATAAALDGILRQFETLTVGLLRSLAVGLFITFAGLALLAIRAGHRARGALVLVTAGFLWLTGTSPITRQDWVLAMLLAGAGAVVMTQRLTQRSVVRRPD